MTFRFILKLAISIICCNLNVIVIAQHTSVGDSLLNALETTHEPTKIVETMLALSREFEGSNQKDALEYARQALEISIKNSLEKESIRSLVQLGNCYIRISDYQSAYENIEKAIEKATNYGMQPEIALSKASMAIIYYELGDFEKSAKYDFENLKYYESVNDQKKIGLALGNIGIDFINLNNYQKGLEYLQKSFEIARNINDLHGMAYQYNNIAGVYSMYFNDNRKALGYYKEALRINSKLNDKRQQAIYWMNIGTCYSSLGINDSILWYYHQANHLFKELNNFTLYAQCQTLIGEFYLKQNLISQSLLHADTAFKVSMQNEKMNEIMSAASLLHKIYLEKKDTSRAYYYAMIEHQVKDSLAVQKNQQEVYKLEFQYNYEKLDKARQIARQKKDNLVVVIIISLGAGLIIIILLFSRHRIKAKNILLEKESISTELQYKDKELTTNMVSLIRKNEMLSDISNKLVEIGKGVKTEETKVAINRINQLIKTSADDKMLKEFSKTFNEVHSGFYKALLEKFPDLTQNELKLCAFLRLNMSTKNISELTGQRVLTIDHARYRLRKKLGISNSEVNLVTFLSQI